MKWQPAIDGVRLAAVWLAALSAAPCLAAPDFVAEVKPILAAHCFSCHGPEKQKSGYRLDVRETALAGGDFGEPAIVPGSSQTSPLLRYVEDPTADVQMPPADSGQPRLTATQVATLRAWIDAGADWPAAASVQVVDPREWWSFKPLAAAALPTLAGDYAQVQTPGESPRPASHPIDAFIRAKLAQHALRPPPDADRPVLIRRLYFDLIGLPPTPAEVQAFIADRNPQAYEKVVDALLASPRYGERWARH
jgi:hypothetical protein